MSPDFRWDPAGGLPRPSLHSNRCVEGMGEGRGEGIINNQRHKFPLLLLLMNSVTGELPDEMNTVRHRQPQQKDAGTNLQFAQGFRVHLPMSQRHRPA